MMRLLLLVVVLAAAARPEMAFAEVADVVLLNRVTWGATGAGLATLRDMGVERWLQWQLHPGTSDLLPAAAQAEIDALPISHTSMPALLAALAEQNRAANQITDPAQKQVAQQAYQQAMTDAARQSAARDILRDLYAPAQLRERMTWFWFNHFNVHQYKADVRPMLADYQESAIRPHALGRFRDLLQATALHPAMVRYLDNAENAAGHINENYAREVMELHSMGVGAGYTQRDVEELARVMTGVGVRAGRFEFDPARHDHGDKVLLGHTIKAGGLDEVDRALDIISRDPATARHVSQEIATYFVADQPPEALVQHMAQAFALTDGDIPTVLLVLFRSPEFAAASDPKFKDPVRYVLSAVRLAYGDRVILNTQPIQGWMNRLGEGLYNHETPDGYALTASAWNGPGQMATRFEVARQIGFSPSGLFKPPGEGATDQPGFPQLQNQLYFEATRSTLSPATRAALDQAVSPQDWNLLFLAAPEFMH